MSKLFINTPERYFTVVSQCFGLGNKKIQRKDFTVNAVDLLFKSFTGRVGSRAEISIFTFWTFWMFGTWRKQNKSLKRQFPRYISTYSVVWSISVPRNLFPNPMSHWQVEESGSRGVNPSRHWHFASFSFVQSSTGKLPDSTTTGKNLFIKGRLRVENLKFNWIHW